MTAYYLAVRNVQGNYKNRLFIAKAHNCRCSSGLITRSSRYFQFLVNRKSPITNRAFSSHGIHFSVLKYYVDVNRFAAGLPAFIVLRAIPATCYRPKPKPCPTPVQPSQNRRLHKWPSYFGHSALLAFQSWLLLLATVHNSKMF